MSYVVLARKFRPQRFADMVGQEHVGRTLGNAIEHERVHHAYLFAGARGLGKTTTARIFAKALVCEKGPTATPCNECKECVAVSEGHSVDVIEIDGASNNSVENIRNLREQVHYLPQTARRKVYIIDEVHMLTTSAFNALLKTLEEPPAHVNFVFATTEPHKVLPTIMSRVSRLDFRRVSPAGLVEHLQSITTREEVNVDAEGLQIVARASGGSVRDSLTLLDQIIAFADDPKAISADEVRQVLGHAERTAVAELADALIDADNDAVIERFDALVTAGFDLTVLAIQLLEHLRDLNLARACKGRNVLPGHTDAEYEALRKQAGRVEPTRLAQMFDRFSRVIDRLPTSRVQRFLLEMGLLELANAEPVMPLGDLIERLDAIGSGGGGPAGGNGASGRPPPGGSSRGRSGGARPRQAAPATPPPREPTNAPTAVSSPPAPPAPPPTAAAPAMAPAEPPMDSELARGLWSMVKAEGVVTQPEDAKATEAPPKLEVVPNEAPAPKRQLEPIDLENLEAFEAWEALVARIRAEDEYVSAVLSEVGLTELDGGRLRVAAPPGSFAHTELTSRPEIRAQVEQATRDHFGRPFTLELVPGEPSLPETPSIVLMDAGRRARRQNEAEIEASEHGAITSVLQQFNARITTTRPLGEPE